MECSSAFQVLRASCSGPDAHLREGEPAIGEGPGHRRSSAIPGGRPRSRCEGPLGTSSGALSVWNLPCWPLPGPHASQGVETRMPLQATCSRCAGMACATCARP